ncbi:MAG: metallophosphoesterase [Candidatus Thorarchaeota archaeon]
MKTRIFFTTDIHGSERCWRKFVNSGPFYEANVVIMGGDITGKAIIPIKQDGTHYSSTFMNKTYAIDTQEELDQLIKTIRNSGYYPYIGSTDEIHKISENKNEIDKLFNKVMHDELKRWIELAEERLGDSEIKMFVCPGNDDRFDIDPALNSSDYVINPDGKVVMIDDDHEMISLGYGNVTPWECPRDVPEEELEERIEAMASKLENPSSAIFNMHVPPYDSTLDLCPVLAEVDGGELQVQTKGGRIEDQPVGSKAVRAAIEKYQPLLGLHGHIHESRGFHKIGRTLTLNPGSEYLEGVLRGAIIDIEKDKIKHFMLTQG